MAIDSAFNSLDIRIRLRPWDDELPSIEQIHLSLIGEDESDHGLEANPIEVVLATMEAYRVESAHGSWYSDLDDCSSDLSSVASVLRAHLDDLLADALDEGAFSTDFIVVDRLQTATGHEGHGYGLQLLELGLPWLTRRAAFAIWEAAAFAEPDERREQRSDSLVDLYRSRVGAHVVSGRFMVWTPAVPTDEPDL